MLNNSNNGNFKLKTHLQFNFIKLSFYLFIFMIFLLAVYSLIPLLNGVFIAFIIFYLINPLVGYFERKQIQRIWIVTTVFIFISLLLIFTFFLIKEVLPTPTEISNFQNKAITNMSGVIDSLKEKYPVINWEEMKTGIIEKINSSLSLTDAIPKIISNISDISSLLVVISFTIFFLLLNEREIKKWVLSFIPNKYFEMSLITIREVDNIFGSYIRGTLLESFVIGVLTTGGWYICGFPFSTAIISGMIVGLLNALPYVGPLFGGVLGVLLFILNLVPPTSHSIFGISPSMINIVVVVLIVQTLDQFIKPLIIGKSVNLHPLIVILGIIAGSNLFGFLGMLLAIPIIAVIKVVISTLYRQLKGFGFLSDNIASVITQKVTDIKPEK